MVARAQNNSLPQRVGRQMQQSASNISTEFKSLSQQVVEEMGEVADVLKEEGARLVNSQKQRVVKQVEKAGDLIHRSAKILRAGKIDKAAEYVDIAAENTDNVADYLKRDALEIADDVADLARRHPVGVFASMFVAGVVVGRAIEALTEDEQ